MNIVIIEDEGIVLDTVTAMIERILKDKSISCKIKNFKNADSVWEDEAFRSMLDKIDIFLIDGDVPREKSGLDLLDNIIATRPSAKVVIMSAKHYYEDSARQKGAVGFLTKPFSLKDLTRVLEELLPA